jgi:hypothetical protein
MSDTTIIEDRSDASSTASMRGRYKIIRSEDVKSESFDADADTQLLSGDVLRVRRPVDCGDLNTPPAAHGDSDLSHLEVTVSRQNSVEILYLRK